MRVERGTSLPPSPHVPVCYEAAESHLARALPRPSEKFDLSNLVSCYLVGCYIILSSCSFKILCLLPPKLHLTISDFTPLDSKADALHTIPHSCLDTLIKSPSRHQCHDDGAFLQENVSPFPPSSSWVDLPYNHETKTYRFCRRYKFLFVPPSL